MTRDLPSVRFTWVNNGAPFVVGHGLLTADDQRRGVLAKIVALNAGAKLVDPSAHESLVALALSQVRQSANIAYFTTLLYSVARRTDPRLAAKTDDELAALLTTDEFEAFMVAIAPAAPSEGAPAQPPLAQPKTSDA